MFRAIMPFLLLAAAPVLADERGQVDALNRQMMALYGQGRYEEATPLAVQIVAILEKTAGPQSLELASGLNNLAELYVKQHRYHDAEPLYKRSLAIRQAQLGPDHPDSVKSMNRLAELYRSEEPPPAAPKPAPAPRPVQQSAAPNPAQQELQHAMQLNQQAVQLTNQGHFAEALPLTTEALAIFEKALGPDNANIAIGLANLAQLQTHLDHYDQAEPLYKRSLAILEKHPDPSHPDLGFTLAGLGDLYARQHKYAEAEPLYRRSLPLLEKALGKDHATVTVIVSNLAEIYRAQNKDPDADPLIKGRWQKTARFSMPASRAATPAAIEPPDPADADRARQLEQKLSGLTNQENFAEALPVALERQAILERLYDPNSLMLAVNLDNLATIYKNLGRAAEADAALKRAQAIRDGARAVDQTAR